MSLYKKKKSDCKYLKTATSTFFIFTQKRVRLYSKKSPKHQSFYKYGKYLTCNVKHTENSYYTLTIGLKYSKAQQSDLYSDLSTNFTSSGLSFKKHGITKYPTILQLVDYM